MKFLIIYIFIAVGTWAGYDSAFKEKCPSDKHKKYAAVAGILWPIFAGTAIARINSGSTDYSNFCED
jgi:hypothetical protein